MVLIRLSDMNAMSADQIDAKIKELYTDYAKMKSQVRSGGAPENSGKMHNIRKTVARLETIKLQKMRAAEKPAGAKLAKPESPAEAVKTAGKKAEKPKAAAPKQAKKAK